MKPNPTIQRIDTEAITARIIHATTRWTGSFLLAVFIAALTLGAVRAAALLTASKTAALAVDADGDGVVSEGDTLEYTIIVSNSGDSDATGVTYTDTLDSNTTFVPGSLIYSPVAVPDVYPETVTGNIRVDSSRIGFSVLSNDNAGSPAITAITADATSLNGGTVSMVTSGANMGQFTYDPPAGYTGTDSFTYTLTNSAGSSTGMVSFTISNMIWFVNNSAASCVDFTAGCGRLSKPFSAMTAFNTFNDGVGNHPAASDAIFVYESGTNYSGTLTLLNGQKLIGQDSTASLASILSITPGSSSDALPANNPVGANTILAGTVVLNTNTLVRGFTMNTASSTALADPAGAITGVQVSEISITTTTGTAVQLSSTGGTFDIKSISSNGAANAISLSSTTGYFHVTGSGGAGSGGTIQNTTSDAIKLNNAANISLAYMNITNSATSGGNNPTCNAYAVSASCEAAIEMISTSQVDLSNLVINGSGMVGLAGNGVAGFSLTDSQILNIGDYDNESAVVFQNLSGTALFEDVLIDNPEEFGIRIYQTSANTSTTIRRVTIQNSLSGLYGEDGLSIRVESGQSIFLVDDSDFLNTGGSGIAASAQGAGGTRLDLTVQNSTWSENRQLPHALAFSTASSASGFLNLTGTNSMNGCAAAADCAGAIDLDASDYSTLDAIVSGVTSTNSGLGTGLEFMVNDYAVGKALITNNSFAMQPARVGMNFMARSVITANSTGRLDVLAQNNSINGISDDTMPGMNIQSGSSSPIGHSQTVCLHATGNTINGTGASSIAFALRQRTGTNFSIQGLTNGTVESAVESYVKGLNPSGNLTGTTNVASVGGTTIVNYLGGACNSPQTAQSIGFEPQETRMMADLPDGTGAARPAADPIQNTEPAQFLAAPQPTWNPGDWIESIIRYAGIEPAGLKADITPVSVGVLPPGASVTIKFQVTVNSPMVPATTNQVSNQGTVTSSLGSILTDDPAKPGAADPTVTLLPRPELTAVLSNSVSGSTTFPTGWTWNTVVTNNGTHLASFSNGQTILSDQLPSSGLSYGSVTTGSLTGVTGTINCSIAASDLTCSASGSVEIATSGSFTVAIPVTPTAAGVFANPRSGGVCQVDPNSSVVELDESNNTCSDSVTVNQPPSITSTDQATFALNEAGAFTVTTSAGFPTATVISLSGSLPAGVTFADNADGTATISGTPTASGSFSVDLTASNGILPDTTQTFELTVTEAPAFSSATSAYFLQGSEGSFTFTAGGFPEPAFTLDSATPALPSGLTFNGTTGVLSGTPGTGSEGVYSLSMRASNGISPDATQTFTLTIGSAPTITSADNAAFMVGSADTFDITTSGLPLPVISRTGALPTGISFVDDGDGTARLSGTAAAGMGGQYPLTISAANGISPDASQSFTLTINEAPAFTSLDHVTMMVGAAGSFTFTSTGYPLPAITIEAGSAALPSGVMYNSTTHLLSGTPAAGTSGQYTLYLKSSTGFGTDAAQTFTLTVNEAPAFTSAISTTVQTGDTLNFTVTTAGQPSPSISITSGSLPDGVTFTDQGDGTATLQGQLADDAGGVYPIELTASNGILPNATQNFTLIVNQAPAFTSTDHSGMVLGELSSFTFTASGYPAPAITLSGTLPGGLTYDNASYLLSGTPSVGTSGVYTLNVSAANGIGTDATQTFTLTVGEAPAFTSSNTTTAVVDSPLAFSITTSGYPSAGIAMTGSLPSGVTFTDNGNGTASLQGTPVTGTGGEYLLDFTAENGINPDASQSFTLVVNESPSITSASSTDFMVGTLESFTFTASGYPPAVISIVSTPALPASLTFTPATALLSGTPVSGDAGEYAVTVTAANGVSPDATQTFTLRIGEQPGFTSPDQTRFVTGRTNTFTISANGTPDPSITFTGDLPDGVTLIDNNDGTATLSGLPAASAVGPYNLVLTAANGVGSDDTQNFTLIVEDPAGVASIQSDAGTPDGILTEGERTNVGIQTLRVLFNKPLDATSAVDGTNYSLMLNGAASIGFTGIIYNPGAQMVVLPLDITGTLLPGDYVLTVKSGLLDENGFALGVDFARTFHIDTTDPVLQTSIGVSLPDGTVIVDGATLNRQVSTIDVFFSEDVNNPAGNTHQDDVTNPANYLLVRPGLDGSFNTSQCASGLAGDDLSISTGPVTYSNGGGSGPYQAVVTVNGGNPLENGTYRLFICGTTSITDLAGNALNGGVDDSRSFTILLTSNIHSNPATGFAPGILTVLPEDTVGKAYMPASGLWIEIPSLKVKAVITGVPIDGSQWDLTWLGKQVGWLEGTAAPTWAGNTALTAHAYTADGLPGPFARLRDLKFGDQIILHADGQKYIYEVKSRELITAANTSLITRHEELDWLTLITCQTYDERTQTYLFRTAVRAVLVKVEAE